MKFNFEKCKVLHMETFNNRTQYLKNCQQLSAVNKKDLRMTISSDFKSSQHCLEIIKTANKLAGFIERAFENKSEKAVIKLYTL